VLCDHIYHIWMFRNMIYHDDNQGRVAQYTQEELNRRMESIWATKEEFRTRLREFQAFHFEGQYQITAQKYESNICWASLIELYLVDAELPIRIKRYIQYQDCQARSCV
jgi:hypothetical protein